MTKTTNYQLNQWDAADPIRREDFNADNAALDAALGQKADQTALDAKAEKTALAAAEKALTDYRTSNDTAVAELNTAIAAVQAAAGAAYSPDNPAYVTGSYIGTGGYGSSGFCTVAVDFSPRLLIVAGGDGRFLIAPRGLAAFGWIGRIDWGETTVAWVSDESEEVQLNTAGAVYYYAVFR